MISRINVFEARLQIGPRDHLKGFRVDVVLEVLVLVGIGGLMGEEPVVKPDFSLEGVFDRDPVNGSFDLSHAGFGTTTAF